MKNYNLHILYYTYTEGIPQLKWVSPYSFSIFQNFFLFFFIFPYFLFLICIYIYCNPFSEVAEKFTSLQRSLCPLPPVWQHVKFTTTNTPCTAEGIPPLSWVIPLPLFFFYFPKFIFFLFLFSLFFLFWICIYIYCNPLSVTAEKFASLRRPLFPSPAALPQQKKMWPPLCSIFGKRVMSLAASTQIGLLHYRCLAMKLNQQSRRPFYWVFGSQGFKYAFLYRIFWCYL